MGIISSIVGAIAGPVIGDILGGSRARKERRTAIADGQVQYSRLRDAAIEGGFNPLTVLQAQGGSGSFGNLPSGVAPLASAAVINNAVQGVSEALSAPQKLKEKAVNDTVDYAKVRMEQIAAGSAGSIAARTRAAQPVVLREPTSVLSASLRPLPAPSYYSEGDIPVFTPSGQKIMLNKRVADRLKLKPRDALMAEDYEAMFGDEFGQVTVLPQLPSSVLNTGVTGADADIRKERVERPYALGPLLPPSWGEAFRNPSALSFERKF